MCGEGGWRGEEDVQQCMIIYTELYSTTSHNAIRSIMFRQFQGENKHDSAAYMQFKLITAFKMLNF